MATGGYDASKEVLTDTTANEGNAELTQLLAVGTAYDFGKIREALKHGAEVNLLVDPGYGTCALKVAAIHGDLDACKFLVEARADINTTNSHKETVLFPAVKEACDLNVVKFFLEQKLDVNQPSTSLPPLSTVAAQMINANYREEFHKKPWPEMLRLLLEHGADPLVGKDSLDDLYWLAKSKHALWAFDILEEVHPREEVGKETLAWRLGWAARLGDLKGLEWALKHGADVDVSSEQGGSALIVAAKFDKKETVAWLLDKKADIDKISTYTAVSTAIVKNHTEVVKLLIDRNADVNAGEKLLSYQIGEELVPILKDAGYQFDK